MPRIAVVGTKGGWSSEKLADAAAEITGERILVEMDRVALDLATGAATCDGLVLNDLDAMVIKKIGSKYSRDLLDRLELLRHLRRRGMKIFSSPESIMRVLDRLSCTVELRLNDIPMPPTTVTEDPGAALLALEGYGRSVLKPLYTSKARGMIVVEPGPEARAAIEEYHQRNAVLYLQKMIDHGGKDLGVAFLGGEYLTTYARRGDGDSWNTTTAFGGKYVPFDPDPEIIEIARKAQAIFGLDFTCVDVAITGQGPMVFEVSAFGGFRGIQATSGIDAARRYIEYVASKI